MFTGANPAFSRLKLRLAHNGRLLLANTSHPRYGVADDDVRASSALMTPWLNDVLNRYRRKQGEG